MGFFTSGNLGSGFFSAGSGGSSPSLILDTVTGALFAGGVRKLRTAYSGAAIRVRRLSDNTEQDIGFSGNDLDTATLLSFCSGTDGAVTTVYNQSGAGGNATQALTANQPIIVSAGVLITQNSKPAMYSSGNKSLGLASNNWVGSGSFTWNCVAGGVGDGAYLMRAFTPTTASLRTTASTFYRTEHVNTVPTTFSADVNGRNSSLHVVTGVSNSGTITTYLDQAAGTPTSITGTPASNASLACFLNQNSNGSSNDSVAKYMSEVIFFPSVVARATLEADQKTYYATP